MNFQIRKLVYGPLDREPPESCYRTVEPMANDTFLALDTLEQNECFLKSWGSKLLEV